MAKLVMLSVIFMNIAIPARHALDSDVRRGLRRALAGCAVFNFFYVFALIYLVPRIM